MLFCNICSNILEIITYDKLKFRCIFCTNEYDAEDDDSLLYEENQSENFIYYDKLLNNAKKDPMNPKAYVKCEKCKNDIVKQVRIGPYMKLINTCIKCNHQFIL